MKFKALFLSFIFLTSTNILAKGREFAGLYFGVGVSLTTDLGSNNRIDTGFVDENGLVRVSKDQNSVARIMLESHYFFDTKEGDDEPWSFLGMATSDEWGHGPFIALQPGTDEIIEAIGIGWMVGFKKSEAESWNLGIGIVVDPSVQTLGDDIIENELLPAGETQIRFKETSQAGLFLLASFSF